MVRDGKVRFVFLRTIWGNSESLWGHEAQIPFSCCGSDEGPLGVVAGNASPTPGVDLRGARMGMAGQVLDVLERHVLGQQVRDHQDAERVRRENLRQPGHGEPAPAGSRI